MVKKRLARLDMASHLAKVDYEARIDPLQTRFRLIQQAYLKTGDSAVIVFEGWDAAGKGGTIRRLSAVMDPRGFKVWPIGAPRAGEADQHYLTRFWNRIPAKSEIGVFDRSWYGRVLVERVEGFAKQPEWSRAYEEINAFEAMLVDAGTRIVKIFLYITPEEQLHRFEKRMADPLKRWKLSYEDFRNRDKWGAYEAAAEEMFEHTDTKRAPWLVLPANDKRYARIEALSEIDRRLSDGVDLEPPPIPNDLLERYKAMIAGR